MRRKRDPLQRKIEMHVPPAARSSALHAMSARAAWGRFVLQRCQDCATVTYPPREVCPVCWGDLSWEDQPRGATLIASTTVRVTTDLYFRRHMPWRTGTVAMDAGPTALANLSSRLAVGERADLRLMLDKGGNAALFALAQGETPDMTDPQWREFVTPVEGATVLVTDGASRIGVEVAKALAAAGAGSIVVGVAAPLRPSEELLRIGNVRIVPLDLTDTRSVAKCLTGIASPLDIVVNTARHVRSGNGLNDQRQAMDVGVLGLSRLTQGCKGMLAGRPNAAFVDIVSATALAPDGDFPGFSAAEAARLSLLHSFRYEMRGAGVRVVTVLTGSVDDDDHQSVPLPKVAPARIGKGVVDALIDGREQIAVGEDATDAAARWSRDPLLYLREKNL